jgi:hypothetical protein
MTQESLFLHGSGSQKTDKEPRFVKLTQFNFNALWQGLWKLALNRHRSIEYWQWLYFENPAQNSYLIVALREGKVIGKTGKVGVRITFEGKERIAGLMEGLVILPEERSWQCVRGLIEKAFDEAQSHQHRLSYGFVTASALALNRYLSAVSLGTMPIFSGFLNIEHALSDRSIPYPFSLIGRLIQPMLGVRKRRTESKDIKIRPIHAFDSVYDEIFGHSLESPNISVIKDAAYLNWRYVQRPGNTYQRFAAYRSNQLAGYIIFDADSATNNGYILELVARPNQSETMLALLIRALDELRKLGVGIVFASFPLYSAQAQILKQLRFNLFASRFWNMTMVVMSESQHQGSPEFAMKNWDLSLGDWMYF